MLASLHEPSTAYFPGLRSHSLPVYRCWFNVESSGCVSGVADALFVPALRFRFTGGAELGGRFFPFDRFPFPFPLASITARIQ